uniref:Fibulin 1 n=1 Tax=Gasterosteus aculeatus aculeatus TaxID=481459 RepID=A0AAQ4R327_GASAC
DRALAGQHCTSTPPISSPNICNITKEQCCSAAVRDGLCDKGVKMAKWQEACETPFFQGEPWKNKISKMCCDCCLLGLMTASQNSSCDFQGFLPGRQCLDSAKACCEKNTTVIKPTTNGLTLYTLMSPSSCVSLLLSDLNCSQLCEGNGTCACFAGYKLQKDGVSCQGDTTMSQEGLKSCRGLSPSFHNVISIVIRRALGGLDTNLNCSQLCEGNGTCGCFAGYELQKDGVSYLNECVARTSTCLPGQTCVNTVGSYTCLKKTISCGQGYHPNPEGTSCEDVDECRTRDVCGGNICVNLVGTYRCECRIGFKFNTITTRCEDTVEKLCAWSFEVSTDVNESKVCGSSSATNIDECAWHNGGHQCSYSCSNVPGSFHCTCPSTGYTLAPNERTCQDIDECALGTHTCSLHGSCFNILGGFRCLSMACPQYFQLAAKDTSASWNCFKVCRPQYVGCYDYPINLISYISISLPTLRVISEPKEITFLRSTAAANYAHLPGGTDVSFKILVADDQSSFDVIKRSYSGMFVGVVRQVKPLRGPKDFVFQVAVNYVKSGVVSYRNIVIIRFFISEFWF